LSFDIYIPLPWWERLGEGDLSAIAFSGGGLERSASTNGKFRVENERGPIFPIILKLDWGFVSRYNGSHKRSHYEEEKMKFANVRELKNKTSEILRRAEKEDVVITSNGKPRAIITGVTEEEFEDYLLEKSPTFLKALEEAREEYLKKGGVSVENYLKTRKSKRG